MLRPRNSATPMQVAPATTRAAMRLPVIATLPTRQTSSRYWYARLLGVNSIAAAFCRMIDSPKNSSSELPSIRPASAGATASRRRNNPL